MNALTVVMCMMGTATIATAQATHNAYMWIEGPSEVLSRDTTYTLEVWGRFESPLWIEGRSAIYGFATDILNTGGGESLAGVSNVVIEPWAGWLVSEGGFVGFSIYSLSGAQSMPDFPMGPPPVEMANPVRLFTFDITTGTEALGAISFAPTDQAGRSLLGFYPDWINPFYRILMPTTPDSALHLSGWTSTVPTPSSLLPLGVLVLVRRRR